MARYLDNLGRWVEPPSNVKATRESDVSEGVLNRGMISSVYPANIPDGAVSLAKNVRVRYDKTLRRNKIYLSIFNSVATGVQGLFAFKDYAGEYKLLMFGSNGKAYKRDGSAWTLIDTFAATILPSIYYGAALYNDTVYVSCNGQGPIHSIDSGLTTLTDLVTPYYKYVTVFYNRVIGANKVGSPNNPIEIGWSADGVPTEWDNSVNETAGLGPLMESPSDSSDFITGIFGFTNVLVVLRERSIWEGTKLPSGSNPFNFYARYAGIGCDCPRSAAVIPNGLIFADTQTRGVYMYNIGGSPELISEAVVEDMFDGTINVENVQGVYDGANREYHLHINNKVWIYNLVTKAWVYDEFDFVYVDQITSMAYLAQLNTSVTYASVSGTYAANANSYASYDSVEEGGIFYGNNFGYLFKADPDDTEFLPLFTENYSSEVESKLYEMPDDDIIINSLSFSVSVRSECSIQLLYSKNGRDFVPIKTFNLREGNSQLVRARVSIRARSFKWKLKSEYGLWDLHKYSLKVLPATMSMPGD